MLSLVIIGAVFAVLIYSAVTDLHKRLIYNIAPLAVLILGVVSLIALPNSAGWMAYATSFAIAVLVGCCLFFTGLMGGGDVKLYAALALHYPAAQLLDLSLATVVAGAALALVFGGVTFANATRPNAVGPVSTTDADNPLRQALKTPIPYGCAILLGHAYMFWAG